MSSGIYEIRNVLNDNVYIGSTVNFTKRWYIHLRELRKGSHHSKYLQNAWNLYGEASFRFAEIEQVGDSSQLLATEQRYLDDLKPAYNMAPVAGRPPILDSAILSARMSNMWASGILKDTIFKKPVERIDADGTIVVYPSASATSEDGFLPSSVGACCRAEHETHQNYRWRFADGSSPEFASKRPEFEVSQISIETGRCLRVWHSQAELMEAGYNYPTVWGCVTGQFGRKTYKNSIWRQGGNINLSMDEVAEVLDSKFSALFRGVVRIDIVTGARKEYASQSAVEADGFRPTKVSACCLGKVRRHGGYYWEFLDGSTPTDAKIRVRKIPSVIHTLEGQNTSYSRYADLMDAGFDAESVLTICENGGNEEWSFSDKTRKTAVTEERISLRANAVQATASDGTVTLYSSMHEAALRCDGIIAKIRECCMGKRKTHAGFAWSFAPEIIQSEACPG